MLTKTVQGNQLLLVMNETGRFVWYTYDERMVTKVDGPVADVVYKNLRETGVSGATWKEAVQEADATWELS